MAAGFAALRAPGTMIRGNELNVDRAVFTCVNAATLTGFQLNVGQGQFNPESGLGPAALLLLTLGGAVFSLCTGGLAAVRLLRLPYTTSSTINQMPPTTIRMMPMVLILKPCELFNVMAKVRIAPIANRTRAPPIRI